MAARRPIRLRELVRTYGWEIMVYLNNLGIRNLAEAQILFVDSNATNALDADDGYHGHSLTNPLATWDYATGLCTAGESCIIILAPRHNEDIGNAQIDLDVTDVHTIGMGSGLLKPRIDFGHANSSINFAANNVTVQGVDFLPAITSILIGVHFETNAVGCWLKDSIFLIGEDGSGADEFIKAVEMTSGNDDCGFENVVILAHASASQATHGIHVAAAADRVTYQNVIIDGPYATGGIVEAAAGVNTICEGCSIDTSGTNYSFDGSSTFAKRTNNVDAGVDSEDAESLIVQTRGTGAYPTGITNESIFAYIMGKGATASASSFDNSDHSLEAIGDNVLAISSPTDVTGAISAAPTAKSLQDILHKDGSVTYSKGDDSLEAISDFVRTGTTLGAGIFLDHLMKTTTGVDLDGDLSVACVTKSLMAHIMSKTAITSTYDGSTDSLEAIADAIAALSFATAVSQTPTARSLQDILEKDNSGSFDDGTDSLEAIRDHIDGTTVLGGIQLDHLAKTADGGTNYPTQVTTNSILGMIMSANGNPSGFNKTTDSLEAISVALLAGTGCTAAIDADQLDTLAGTDTTVAADGDLTAHCLDGSILAHIMSATKDTSTYKCTTDSLEAIAVALAAGTGCDTAITSNQLDTLTGSDTGVALDGELTPHAVDGSLMSHIMSATKDTTTYKASTDSLEAIAVALAAGTGCSTALDADQLHKLVGTTTGVAAGSDLEAACVAGSLMSHVLGVAADVTTFDARTDSLEALSDKLGAYTFDAGGDDEDTVMAHLDLIYADTAVIDVAAPRLHTRTLTNWALSATNALFDVSGMVRARIWGEVLVQVAGVATNIKVSGVPTAPGGAVDICANLDCNADAAGTVYKMATTLGGAMQEVTGGVCFDDGIEVILPAGTVVMGSSANEAGGGSIQWFIQYEPLEDGAVVTST